MVKYAAALDIGGTFTDITLVDVDSGASWTAKTPSTPSDPSIGFTRALLKALALPEAGPEQLSRVLHATTVATNAILEQKKSRLGLLTTSGFRYVLEIGRQEVPAGQTLWGWVKPDRPVSPELIYEIPERMSHEGRVLIPLNEDEVRRAARELRAADIQSIAVCFLHSYANPEHERRAAEIVREECPDLFVSLSSEILPKFREYERTTATVLNSHVMPHVSSYLFRLKESMAEKEMHAPLLVMKSSGGVTTGESAAEQAIHTVLSGPVAGVVGAVEIARLSGFENLISIDVGGTSADVCLVRGLQPEITFDGSVGDFPLQLPMVDITTIGAGGGSIASVSTHGRLTVGPRSAGADPGPVCYKRGGTRPTLTDAYLVLGRIPSYLLGGEIPLDAAAAAEAIESQVARPLGITLIEAAEAIVGIATNNMAGAIRAISIARGHDPRNFALVPFGGAGALHGLELAQLLGIRTVLVPAEPGVLSTYGLLSTDLRNDYVRTFYRPGNSHDAEAMQGVFELLVREAEAWLTDQKVPVADRVVLRAVDARYEHQGFELTVPIPDGPLTDSTLQSVAEQFHAEHERLYTYRLAGHRVEMVNARVTAIGRLPRIKARELRPGPAAEPIGSGAAYVDGVRTEVRRYRRQDLGPGASITGPAIVEQNDTTVWVRPGWTARSNSYGILAVEVEA